MMVKLRLRLYHLDALACDAITTTYFWMTGKQKLKVKQRQKERMNGYEWARAHFYSNPCREPSPKVNPE